MGVVHVCAVCAYVNIRVWCVRKREMHGKWQIEKEEGVSVLACAF